jgi:hypothetical protein
MQPVNKIKTHLSVNSKDGSNGDKAVYVGRPIKRIKTHNILALKWQK